MTNQEAFDKAAVHLIRQGQRSEAPDGVGGCLYRGPNGLKCAIGCLIPDEVYSPRIEGTAADMLRGKSARAASVLNGVDDGILQGLQSIHDYDNPPNWRLALREFAAKCRLSAAALDAEPLGPAERP